MIEFNNEKYAIDIDRFFEVFSGNESDVNTVITATYSEDGNTNNDLSLISKEVVESKRNGIETLYGLRYETLKYLVDTLFTPQYDDVNGGTKNVNTYDDLTFAQKIAFNSLLNEGILIKILN